MSVDFRMISLVFLVILVFLFSPPAFSEDPNMILSKADAKTLFNLSLTDWNKNVEAAEVQGLAKIIGEKARGLGMATANPTGFMIVRPDYSTEAKPDFIQVTVAFLGNAASLVLLGDLEATIVLARSELSPEFLVVGNVKKTDDESVVFFIISEN